ncbi:MAG: anaerobic ribonucleoside-triphosphate reductase activating protein [Burkholderiales bacterium]|nr:anaerobic ribonucleoside-triphosphate reductase activating protein [Burkholderiales bacterium]
MPTIIITPDEEIVHKEADSLCVAGITKLTTIDFPGCLAAVIFLRGCPWRCLYCQNKDLQQRQAPKDDPTIPWKEIDKFLNKRKGLLDGVVFSGGEPLTDPALFKAIEAVKAKGFKIGLHTAGIFPSHLASILPMVDWIGLDIKAPLTRPELYERVTGRKGTEEKASKCLVMILDSGVQLEVRTTAHPSYLTDLDIKLLAEDLAEKHVDTYALQIYRQPPQAKKEDLLERVGSDYPAPETVEFLRKLFKNFILRNQ